jgi:tetratricopeptide (TPR) repeat protein
MLYNRALTHMENRELGPTQKTCLKILSLNKDHAGSHMLLGVVASEFGKLKNAVEFLDRAANLDDRSAETWAQLARVRSLQRRFEDAEAAAKRARELNSDSAYIWDTLGVVYSRINNHALAAEMFRRAIDIKPDVASYWFNYGSSLQFNGEIEHAEEAYNTAIGLNDRFYKAHSALAQLRKQTKERNHVTRLTGLLDHVGDNADGELHLRHALAKECEDMARYDEAFAHLLAGKQRKTATLDYNIKHDAAIFAEIARTFPPDQPITPATSSPVDEPIFVIGMPRTGTTLVERILSSHPSVNSAGELQTFGLQLKRETGTPSRLMLDPETVAAAKNCNIAAVGKRYLREGYRIAGLASRFVDKMPLNFHYAGFIHQALPNAKFVCLQRNPMDTILSNFRQLFAVNFSYYNYAFDIKDTASYYLMFRDIIDRWQELLPDHMLQVSYEDLVENQEQVTRRILEHCNLPWEDACLTFEQNPSPVATASAVQVRQPMYRKAISRWKHYEKQLEPAQIKLEAAGIKIQ